MAENKHFSHQHSLTFHKSLEAAQLTCSGCKFPCTGTPIYSCRPCKFFLHEQCFNATRSLNHPLHPKHPLSLFPSPTYPSGSFICNLCNKSGSAFSFCCSTCEFDLHIHCAYNNDLNPKPETSPLPNKFKLKTHLNHKLHYLVPPYERGACYCDVCGIDCDPDAPLHHCDKCRYDVHVECFNLQETIKQDHQHELSLFQVNPCQPFKCDICKGTIARKHYMYLCKSGCDYGIHVKCVSAKVIEKTP